MRIDDALATTGKAVLILLALGLLSCASVSSIHPRAQLVGKWRSTTADRTAEYAFAPDGTFSGSVTSQGATLANFTGRWTVKSGAISYEYLTDKTGNIPPGTRDQDRLLSISPEQYAIQAADGSRRTYRRVLP